MHTFILVLAFATTSTVAAAATFEATTTGPLGFDSGTQIRGSVTVLPPREEQDFNTASDGSQSGAQSFLDTTFRNRADLSTGEVGVYFASTPTRDYFGGSTQAKIFDVLTFDTTDGAPSEISYAVDYDGVITNNGDDAGADNIIAGSTSVRIFDVSDLGTAFEVRGRDGSLGNEVTANSIGTYDPDLDDFVFENLVSRRSGGLAVVGSSLADRVADGRYSIGGANEYVVDDTGLEQSFSGTLTDTFTVQTGRRYALTVSTNIFAQGDLPVLADLFSTSRLSFTAPDGTTIFSSSGVLPGTSAAPAAATVPLPAAGWLFVGALGAIGMLRRVKPAA